jgi:RimJ/RimL family protein N-acetyltransferase
LYIIETERLGLRKLTEDDFEALRPILGDPEVMYAWEHGFSDEEIRTWIGKIMLRYEQVGFSYFAAIDKESGRLIGTMGPLMEDIDGEQMVGVAYILGKAVWGRGYAAEGAAASIEYAFSQLGTTTVIASIRPDNATSLRVAEKLGMVIIGEHSKPVHGKEVRHLICAISK